MILSIAQECSMECYFLLYPNWPVGLMDKASASGAGDSRFESWAGHVRDRFLLKRMKSPPAGLEPAIFGLEVRRLVH